MADEQPAWLVAAVDQRLALMLDHLPPLTRPGPGTVIMTPLSEPNENATAEEWARWERTCDRCHTYVPDDEPFYTGHVQREHRDGFTVVVMFGVCAEHRY